MKDSWALLGPHRFFKASDPCQFEVPPNPLPTPKSKHSRLWEASAGLGHGHLKSHKKAGCSICEALAHILGTSGLRPHEGGGDAFRTWIHVPLWICECAEPVTLATERGTPTRRDYSPPDHMGSSAEHFDRRVRAPVKLQHGGLPKLRLLWSRLLRAVLTWSCAALAEQSRQLLEVFEYLTIAALPWGRDVSRKLLDPRYTQLDTPPNEALHASLEVETGSLQDCYPLQRTPHELTCQRVQVPYDFGNWVQRQPILWHQYGFLGPKSLILRYLDPLGMFIELVDRKVDR